MIGESGVQFLADDAADEVAKCRRDIRTDSVAAVCGRTGASRCATRAGTLDLAPPDLPNRMGGRRLEKPSGLLGAGARSGRLGGSRGEPGGGGSEATETALSVFHPRQRCS